MSEETALPYEGDMTILERGLAPQEAQIRASFLRSFGMNADAGNVNVVQANALLALALGGACVRVPLSRMQDAADLLAAQARGEFALADDFGGSETAP